MVGASERWLWTRAVLGSAVYLLVAACGHQAAGEGPDAAVAGDAPMEPPPPPPPPPPQQPRCGDMPATCGPAQNEDCCQANVVPGATFYRSYDGVGFTDMRFPATVSDFALDRYEVTVARFRAFVEAGQGTQIMPPAAGAGAHPTLTGSGWDSAWNGFLETNKVALTKAIKCGAAYQTWTDTPGANENEPINCVTWYEAMAFCIWDGGYLPTEAEWNFAASGGSEQRVYPWSSPTTSKAIDCTYANYFVDSPVNTFCVNGATGGANRVGSESTKGDGRWGHADLAGGVWEWTLDWYATAYSATCNDCANLTPDMLRVVRGASFLDDAGFLRASSRGNLSPGDRANVVGLRCARAPK